MNRMFGKMSGEPVHRFFDKLKSGGNRFYDKVKTQVFNNPRTLHSIAHGLDDVGRYGGAVGKIGAGVATGLGHPEIGAVFSAGSALAGAAGHAGHLVDDRANFLQRRIKKEEQNPQQFFA